MLIATAYSDTQHKVFTNAICAGVLQAISISAGLVMSTAKHLALEMATFNRFLLYRNSMFRGRSSPLEVAIEMITTSASCP